MICVPLLSLYFPGSRHGQQRLVGDMNLYQYVGAGPTGAIDPSGLDSVFGYFGQTLANKSYQGFSGFFWDRPVELLAGSMILHPIQDAFEGPEKYRIIEVDIPDTLPNLHLDPNLDLRGPARYLDGCDLPGVTPRPHEG